MAITFVAASANAAAASGNLTVTPPVTQTDDIMLCAVTTHDNVLLAFPLGWTIYQEGNNTAAMRATLAWKRAVGAEAPFTITHPLGDGIVANVAVYRGCVTDATVINASVLTPNASSSTCTAATILTSVDGCMIVFTMHDSDNGSSSVQTSAGLGAMAERFDNASILGLDEAVSGADVAQAVQGFTGASTGTLSLGPDVNSGGNTALKPAPTVIVKTVTDSGSGTDAVGIAVAMRQTDGGAGLDTPRVPAESLRVVDAAAGSDAAQAGPVVTIADSGAGADAAQPVAAAIPVADSGVGTESPGVSVDLAVAEQGAGADAAQAGPLVSAADSGAGLDSASVQALIPLVDSGTGADIVGAAAGFGLTDLGAGSEAFSVGAAVALADGGAGVDAPTVVIVVPVSDSGSGADTVTIPLVSLTVVDAGAGADGISLGVLAAIADAGIGADAVTAGASLSLLDEGAGVDAVLIEAVIPVGEAGAGTDVVAVVTGGVVVTIADSGAGSEAVTVTPQGVTLINVRARSRIRAVVTPNIRDESG